MAVRFSAANQRYLAGGFSGGVTTILCWARIATDTNAAADIWVLYNGTETTPEAGLGTNTDGTSMLLFDSATTMAGPNMVVGDWYCFAAVLNGTSYTLYYGTDPMALTTVGPSTKVAVTSPASMTISQAVEPWNGNVAAFKMYTVALSLADIQNELTQYQPVRTASLLRYHPFVNAELIDYSGNGNSLTAGAGTATTEPGPPIRWEGRWRERHLINPAAPAIANPNAGNAGIGMAGQNPTVTTTRQVGSSPTPLAAYSFNESSGPVIDRTGNGHDFAVSNSLLRSVSGHTGGGMATNGGGTTATLASPAFGQSANRTLAMWMINPANTTQWVVRWNVNSLGSGSWGFLLLGTEVSVQARNSSTFERAACNRPTDGLWHHYAATFDNATHSLRFYLDGVETQNQTALTAPLRTDADTIDIGEWTDTSTVIDDLRIYDSVLTQSQIQHLAGEPVPPDLTARFGMAGQNAEARVRVDAHAGTGPIVATAWDGTSAHQSLACANLSAIIVPVRLSAIITLGDELSADITQDLLATAVGKDEYFADVGICGRS